MTFVDQIVQAANQQQQQQPPGQVPLQALPEMWAVGQTVGPDGKVWVTIQIQGPYGVLVHLVPADAARKIGADLQKAGSSSELLIANG